MSITEEFNTEENLYLDKGARECWKNSFGNQTSEEIYIKLTRNLPAFTSIKINFYNNSHWTRIACKNSSIDSEFNFTYSQSTIGTVLFEHGDVFNDKNKKKGISKNVQRNFLEFFKETDVKNIELFTKAMGLYAWSRLGFKPIESDWKNIQTNLNRRLDLFTPLAEKASQTNNIEKLRELSNSKYPQALWEIVDDTTPFALSPEISWGKALTMDIDILPASIKTFVRSKDYDLLSKTNVYEENFNMEDIPTLTRASNYLYKTYENKTLLNNTNTRKPLVAKPFRL